MNKQELERMNDSDLVKYIDEQKKLGKNGLTQIKIAEILEVNINTFKTRMQKARKKVEPSNTLETPMSTPMFTDSEIKVIKEILKERESDIQLFHEYRIYKELGKVPTDVEQVRSAFNMSKETTERLRKFASVRRIPLQDIVELAVINLLNQYDQGGK